MNSNDQKEYELNQFLKHHKAELGQVTKNLEKAKVEYEKALKNFVSNHITSKAHFKNRIEQVLKDTRNSLTHEKASNFVDDVMALEIIIGDEIYWLEEGQFGVEDSPYEM